MCGIAAIFSYGVHPSAIDESELLRIREQMYSRGPDGAGIWVAQDRRVGLAHRRLAIIDLDERSAQPMVSSDGRYRITFNGEIYNFRELRSEMERKGVVFRTQSDTEVLLEMYAAQGRSMLDSLRGMFAFTIWDSEKKGMFLARDPFGIKPLYYSDNGKTLRVASQVKALLAGGGISGTPDPIGRAGFLTLGNIPEPFTYYEEIKALPAGSSMWVDSNGRKECYRNFAVSDLWKGIEESHVNFENPSEQLRALLQETVNYHLISDVPIGVFLSAGLDSSSIAGFASESCKALNTVTLGFDEYKGTDRDEVPTAEAIAHYFGAKHFTQIINERDFIADFEMLLNAMDQPTIDGVNMYFVCRATQQAGLKVALSGVGGDELFGGYESFRQIPRVKRRLRPLKMLPGLGKLFRVITSGLIGRMTSPKYSGVLEFGNSVGGLYFIRRGLFMPWELPSIMGSDEAREGWKGLEMINSMNTSIDSLQYDHSQISVLEAEFYMRNQILRDADWSSMAHSVEVRVPLVDTYLWKGVAPLVHRYGMEKRDMAKTLENAIPRSIIDRPKSGFSIPVEKWLLKGSRGVARERGLRGWALQLDRHWLSRGDSLVN